MAIITRLTERLTALEERVAELEKQAAPKKVTSKSAPKAETD
jgi:BMFP domain-containing protein YqiC